MIILLVGMLVGCSDDGGENPFEQSATGTGVLFTGRLIGTVNRFDHALLGMDLESGRFTPLPGNCFFATNGAFDSNGDVDASRDPSVSSGAVLSVDDCLVGIDNIVCFYYVDRDDTVTGKFEIDSSLPGPSKLSPDGTQSLTT